MGGLNLDRFFYYKANRKSKFETGKMGFNTLEGWSLQGVHLHLFSLEIAQDVWPFGIWFAACYSARLVPNSGNRNDTLHSRKFVTITSSLRNLIAETVFSFERIHFIYHDLWCSIVWSIPHLELYNECHTLTYCSRWRSLFDKNPP